MKVLPEGTKLFHAEGQTDGQTGGRIDRHTDRHYETNIRFLQFSKAPKNWVNAG
jgi:hypothetical protein